MTAARTAPVVALVPARSPGRGLSRLAGVLSPEQRAALGRAMLGDVLAALEAAPVDRVLVAASGSEAADAARTSGVEVVCDPPDVDDLDDAVAAAVGRLTADAHVLVVMADLPCLSAQDVAEVLAHPAQVVVAVNDDGGTGALLRRPASVMATAYGAGSAARHVSLAERAGCSLEIVHAPGFAFDVDTAEDLTELSVRAGVGASTARFLRALDVAGGTAATG